MPQIRSAVKPAAFKYRRAGNAGRKRIALLGEAGEDARFLAGGQSLVPMMNFRLARPSVLVDLNGCADLAFVRREGGRLRIGAMTRQWDAEHDALVREHVPMVAAALSHAGPLTVRNRATVGGTLANGYPLAQLPCVAACLEAEMVLEGPQGERIVAAKDFFVAAMVTAIEPGELLREIRFPALPRRPAGSAAALQGGRQPRRRRRAGHRMRAGGARRIWPDPGSEHCCVGPGREAASPRAGGAGSEVRPVRRRY